MIADHRFESLGRGEGSTLQIHVKDVGHQKTVLPNHLHDLSLGLIDQLPRPDDNLLKIANSSPDGVDGRQCGLDYAVDDVYDRLNSSENTGLRVGGLWRSCKGHDHDTGKSRRD